MATSSAISPRALLVVAAGGIAGSLLRWAFSLWIPSSGFPLSTLLVNYIGSGILMAVVVFANHHPAAKWWWRPALGSGFCGGFTTYSAFAVKVEQYLQANRYGAAIGYMTASIIGTYLIIIAIHKMANQSLQRAGHV
jgi:CrcB protein